MPGWVLTTPSSFPKMRRKVKRTVPLSPNLAKWLKDHPFEGVPRARTYRMKVLKGATKARSWISSCHPWGIGFAKVGEVWRVGTLLWEGTPGGHFNGLNRSAIPFRGDSPCHPDPKWG